MTDQPPFLATFLLHVLGCTGYDYQGRTCFVQCNPVIWQTFVQEVLLPYNEVCHIDRHREETAPAQSVFCLIKGFCHITGCLITGLNCIFDAFAQGQD